MRAETKEFGDIVRLDSTDTYADLARKTLKLFSKLPDKFDASFYFKVGVACSRKPEHLSRMQMHLSIQQYDMLNCWVCTMYPPYCAGGRRCHRQCQGIGRVSAGAAHTWQPVHGAPVPHEGLEFRDFSF